MSASGFFVSEQTPLLGRGFLDGDERPGAPPVVVLTYHIWQDRNGRDPSIIGQTIRIDDVPTTVIGVMPARKRFPEDTDLWTPLVPDARAEDRADRALMLFGRLPEDGKTAVARRELGTIAGRLAKGYPSTNKGLTVDLHPIAEITGAYNMRPIFAALWAAVGFVLLIACADVATNWKGKLPIPTTLPGLAASSSVRHISRSCESNRCWGASLPIPIASLATPWFW